jgi:hypothetical protein
MPKSNAEIIKGRKLREKTTVIFGIDEKGDKESCITQIRWQLQESVK